MGGDAIFESLKDHLGIGNDETTEDGSVTLQHIECNAACDFAPVVMVNWEFYDNQTVESARDTRRRAALRKPAGAHRVVSRCCAHSKRPSESWQVFPTRGQTRARAVPARRHWPGCEVAKERNMIAPRRPSAQRKVSDGVAYTVGSGAQPVLG